MIVKIFSAILASKRELTLNILSKDTHLIDDSLLALLVQEDKVKLFLIYQLKFMRLILEGCISILILFVVDVN